MRRLACSMGLLLPAIIGTLTGRAAEPVKAKLMLKGKDAIDVQILSRAPGNWFYFREAGKEMEVGLQEGDIDKIVFPVELDGDKLEDLYSRGQYKASAELLGNALRPTLPFCDLPSNVSWPTRLYLKSLCWEGRYQEVLDIATVMAHAQDPATKQQALLFHVLGLVGLNRLADADLELKKVGALSPKDEAAPLYWYALAQLQIARNEWPEAQETTARIVTFCGKDLEWLLPGLALSARCYANAGQDDVVGQIAREMNQMYPKSRWSAQTTQLAAEVALRHPMTETPAVTVDSKTQPKGTKP